MTELRYLQAVSSAQAFMATVVKTLKVDGKWGSYTNSVYNGLSFDDRRKVDGLVRAIAGCTVADLVAHRAVEKTGTAGYDRAEIVRAINSAADELGIDRQVLLVFAQIESNFNPRAKNGSSQGLMQMQPAAWADASKIVSLRPYAEGVWDPVENARAGAAYIKSNRKVLDRLGYRGPWDVAHMYLAHQQGAGGLNNMYKAAHGQTGSVSAEHMVKNPPPDGKGPTTDPAQFYQRWVNVVNKKVS